MGFVHKAVIAVATVTILGVSGIATCFAAQDMPGQMACCSTMPDCSKSLTPRDCCAVRAEQPSETAVATPKVDTAATQMSVAVLSLAQTPPVPLHRVGSLRDLGVRFAPHAPPYLRNSVLLI